MLIYELKRSLSAKWEISSQDRQLDETKTLFPFEISSGL